MSVTNNLRLERHDECPVKEKTMRTYRAIVGGMAALMLAAAAARADAGHHRIASDALQRFQEGVQAYVTLHRQIERLLPPMELPAEPRAIQQWGDACALEIALARRSAREGDIIDAAAAAVFRAHIKDALGDRGRAAVLGFGHDAEAGGLVAPEVNARVRWSHGSFMPASLLDVLPALPLELQYRFIGPDLVLIDVGAGLVVDVLREALPPAFLAV